MRKYALTSIVFLPLLLSFSHAAQSPLVPDPPEQPVMFWSEDSGSGFLGVDIADVTSERVSTLKLKEEKGVEVTAVDQDAPAGKAGIKEHDVILTMNGTTVESAAQLRRMIHETPAGRVITLGLSRDGQPVAVKVQLCDRPKEYSFSGPNMKDFHVQIPEIHVPPVDIPSFNMVIVTSSERSGLTVENITPQLGEFFGVKNGSGVLVRSVEKGSRAEKAGLRAGDVIVKVNDEPVHDTSDFTHAVRSRKGDAVSVNVIRDKKEQNLQMMLPEHKESGDLLEEESWDDEPLMNAESALELSKLQGELAEVQPAMQLADEDLRQATKEVRKAFCREQKETREQKRQREDLRKEQQKLEREMERMSREMGQNGFDI